MRNWGRARCGCCLEKKKNYDKLLWNSLAQQFGNIDIRPQINYDQLAIFMLLLAISLCKKLLFLLIRIHTRLIHCAHCWEIEQLNNNNNMRETAVKKKDLAIFYNLWKIKKNIYAMDCHGHTHSLEHVRAICEISYTIFFPFVTAWKKWRAISGTRVRQSQKEKKREIRL